MKEKDYHTILFVKQHRKYSPPENEDNEEYDVSEDEENNFYISSQDDPIN